MKICSYTVYYNFISEPMDIWMNDLYGKHINMKLLTKFEYVGDALEEKELLSYCLFVPNGYSVFAGGLLFPWMASWKYEGEYFNEMDLKEIGLRVYY